MSRARQHATIGAIVLLVVGALVLASRSGNKHESAALGKQEFVRKADAVCAAANRKQDALETPPIDFETADKKTRDIWLDSAEEKRRIIAGEVRQLAEIVPPKNFQEAWKEVVDGLDAAAARLSDVTRAVRKGDGQEAAAIFDEINQIGENSSSVMRGYGMKVCGHSSSGTSGASS